MLTSNIMLFDNNFVNTNCYKREREGENTLEIKSIDDFTKLMVKKRFYVKLNLNKTRNVKIF